ncbi:MAG: YetF domain-containing protein [Leeuwenhoekiella sp.]
MKEDEIYFGDWSRMFIGKVPMSFFVEAFIRMFVIYLLLVVAMRLMENRFSSLVSRNEMAAMVALAAAIGIPVQAADKGLLPPIIVAVIVVVIDRVISLWAFNHQKFEEISQGDYSVLVENGVMQFIAMKRSRVSREAVIAQLRNKSIKNLGNVKRLYMEAGGSFTLIQENEVQSGLSIIPEWDTDFIEKQESLKNEKVCLQCGNKIEISESHKECSNCGAISWVNAIK